MHNAQLIAKCKLRDPRPDRFSEIDGELARFDFDNLQEPVPVGVYFDARDDCFGTQSHCQTITEGDYRPKIVLKNAVWQSVLLKHWSCGHPGLFDPPIMLQPVTRIADPVVNLVRAKTATWNDQPSPIMAAPGVTIPAPLTRLTPRPSPGNEDNHKFSSQGGDQTSLGGNDGIEGLDNAVETDERSHNKEPARSEGSSHSVEDRFNDKTDPEKAGGKGRQAKPGGLGSGHKSAHKVGQQQKGGSSRNMDNDIGHGAGTNDKHEVWTSKGAGDQAAS